MSCRMIAVMLMCLLLGMLGGCSAKKMKTLVDRGPGIPKEGVCFIRMGSDQWTTSGWVKTTMGGVPISAVTFGYEHYGVKDIESHATQLSSNVFEVGGGEMMAGLRAVVIGLKKSDTYYSKDPNCEVIIEDKSKFGGEKQYAWFQVEIPTNCGCEYFLVSFGETIVLRR